MKSMSVAGWFSRRRLGVGGLALLAGCASDLQQDLRSPFELVQERGYRVEREVKSITRYQASGWVYLNPLGIVLRGSPHTAYLVTFVSPCSDLGPAESLITSATGNRLTDMDTLSPMSVGGGADPPCLIESLYRLKKETAEPKQQGTPQPG